MKKFLFMLLGATAIVSCNKFDLNYDEARQAEEAKETQEIKENAAKIFGEIDPRQDWNSINSGTISVTANANLSNIVKVQILTESPLLNTDAKVLAEANASNGQTVTLNYDAPNVYKQLFAACINNKGVYHIQVFDLNQSSVKFANTTASAAPRRASKSEAPTITSIILKAPQKSFNTQRTEISDAEGSCKIGSDTYTVWKGSGWSDMMWEPADGQTFDNGWQMDTNKDKGHIYRSISGFAEGEEANVKGFINSYAYKYGDDGKSKKNNVANVRNSEYFKQNTNYVYSNGTDPVTLIPIQAYSTEFRMNHIFYYYYKPEEIPAGMDEVAYIKTLPKYKAIQIEHIQSGDEATNGVFFHRQEFLLPYYKNSPVEGVNEASAIFPEGYKIGFLNMKNSNGDYNPNKDNRYGCIYGDGRLNFEVNHIKGHYLSAMDKSIGGSMDGGMNWTDPRMAMFTVNEKTYMCIEEGADCNFSDMVIEISGIKLVQETPEPEAEVYTMCFEDRPNTADYDLNDVVLRCTRKNSTTLILSIVATGAQDNVYIHGATGWAHNDKEVHELFGAVDSEGKNQFVNTEKGGNVREAITAEVTVSESLSIPSFLKNIFIENRSTGKVVKVPETGQPPFAVIVPEVFKYPLERVCINNAYLKFKNWAQDMITDKDWYTEPETGKVYE